MNSNRGACQEHRTHSREGRISFSAGCHRLTVGQSALLMPHESSTAPDADFFSAAAAMRQSAGAYGAKDTSFPTKAVSKKV